MTYRVLVSDTAERDMKGIGAYISDELHAPQAALDLLDDFRRQIHSLNCMPKRFPLVPDESLAAQGIRLIPVKSYHIFYVVEEHTQTVNIVSVMYGKRDWMNLL